ncbi:hypothetical protein H8356DRAFT_1370578 [Neocallimastix lanati (nom. inval.)]|nr:hypothetical protein H8356DRAFT_1370578 [Neocallimastix sp. JGI-2020a]
MNIIKFYLILLFFITSNANSILLKRNSIDIKHHVFDSEECNNELKNSEIFNECMPSITLGNYKQKCNYISSKKCQDFYNDSGKSKYFPICNRDTVFNEILQPIIFTGSVKNLYNQCFTDEQNNLCPYSIYVTTGGNEVLNDTCKSEKCTNILVDHVKKVNLDQLAAYENLSFSNNRKFTYQETKAFKEIVSMLESDRCKSMHITSNGYTIKVNSNLLYILFLL